MPKKVKLFAVGVFLALTGILCLSLLPNPSLAETDIFGLDGPFDGDGWSMSADGVLTIESNQGWANCIRHGYKPEVKELVIGKDVTYFRMYRLPDDLQSPDYFDACPITYIEIPKTIEEIGACAFSDCDMLYQVILRAGLKRLE